MKYAVRVFFSIVIFGMASQPVLLAAGQPVILTALLSACFLLLNCFPSAENRKLLKRRLRICADGSELLILFLISASLSALFQFYLLFVVFPADRGLWFWNLIFLFLTEAAVFWNGILRVYATSFQLGLRWRVLGVICGFVPLANLAVLWKIIAVASLEARFESERLRRDRERKEQKVCRTRYPLLLVHGVFFRDFKYLNYWGRIPKALEENGAVIYYGNHQSAASVADSGRELARRILEITEKTGCGRVNVIAHSKGGLDTRYAVSMLGMDQYVASLTTISTPHRGCLFADYLLEKIPRSIQENVAAGYNAALKRLGDKNPDFLAAVYDLTASACRERNRFVLDRPGVFYQSVGSKLNRALDGRFPLNFSHRLVRYFDGPNDGLVAENSFPWGTEFRFLTTKGNRGISHGDMVDLNRENIPDFDVREFYVSLVRELKEKGF